MHRLAFREDGRSASEFLFVLGEQLSVGGFAWKIVLFEAQQVNCSLWRVLDVNSQSLRLGVSLGKTFMCAGCLVAAGTFFVVSATESLSSTRYLGPIVPRRWCIRIFEAHTLHDESKHRQAAGESALGRCPTKNILI